MSGDKRMKFLAPLTVFAATPALAHDGMHIHPHDGASWMVVAAALSVIAGAVALRMATAKAKASK